MQYLCGDEVIYRYVKKTLFKTSVKNVNNNLSKLNKSA